mgnify:CR=1 FL=1
MIIRYITYGKYYSLIYKFILESIVKIIIEQTIEEAVVKRILFRVLIRRLFYKFLLQEILWHTIGIKTPVWIIWLILLLISRTSRITIVGEENLKGIKEEKKRVIFAFWHGHYTLLLTSLHMDNAVALVHRSFRGNYVARLFSIFNYRIVRTLRGESIRELMNMIIHGYSGFIAVDGPEGPAQKTKPGIIYIAQKTGARIVPLTIEAHKGFTLKRRWDHHFIPFPFNNITVSFGKCIDVDPDDSLEIKGEEVTRSLLALTKESKY